jgi:hypothetical protein
MHILSFPPQKKHTLNNFIKNKISGRYPVHESDLNKEGTANVFKIHIFIKMVENNRKKTALDFIS